MPLGSDVKPAALKSTSTFEETIIMPHDEVGLDLTNRVERNTDDDQERGSAEEKGCIHHLAQIIRQYGNGRYKQRSAQGDLLKNPLDVLSRCFARPDPRN